MSEIDSVIADVQSVLETLSGVHSRLRELKEDSEAVEKARDKLRAQKTPRKNNDTH